jgi:molybdopterin synthase catalytic subunit
VISRLAGIDTVPNECIIAIYDLRHDGFHTPTIPRPHLLKRQLTITAAPIDEPSLMAGRQLSRDMGAVVCFLGVVRGDEEGKPIGAIEYETFLRMAEHQFHLLFDEIEKRWPVESVRLVHRIGVVAVNEPSLWVEVVAPHRGEAFAACQWLIDQMKRVVPIWKKPIGPRPSA